jgi:lysophospholipase L1-like esterase
MPRGNMMPRFAVASLACALAVHVSLAQPAPGEHWVGTWAAAAVIRPPARPPASGQPTPTQPVPVSLNNQTLRQIVHVSIGGSQARVLLTNVFGTAPLSVGAAQIALREKDSKIVTGSNRPLTFSRRSNVIIPAGAVMLSDPVALTIPPMSDVIVDLFLPDDLTQATLSSHFGANQTSYISSTGNFAGAADFPVGSTTPSWFYLSRLEVTAPARTAAIVAFGDSITDGTRSTINTNSRWPDVLARRLLATPSGAHGILNAAIAGNRLLTEGNGAAGFNALSRYGRDVLDQPGITDVIVLEGINDIGVARDAPVPSAEDLIAAHEQMAARAHEHGLKIYGATLTPYEGAAYFSPAGETKRQAFNTWIRSNKSYDGVIDFDAVVRDPESPTKMLARYDSGDHLHPNDAGYEAMGSAIDLKLFDSGPAPKSAKSKRK